MGPSSAPPSNFPEATHWSLVLAAGGTGEPARQALARLCEAYWPVVYAFVRRRVPAEHDAQDLTQEFFTRFIERNACAKADPQRGRFRSFLMTSVSNFLATEHEHAHALKRGGGRTPFRIEFDGLERTWSLAADPAATPEALFDRKWALALLAHVVEKLGHEFEKTGKSLEFAILKPCLGGAPDGAGHRELARALGVSEAAARATLSRFRRRYRELLRREIAQTLAAPTEEAIDEELRALFAAVGR
jgi:RNA polymerase sigma-70 factor (ECF subfamily)